MSLHHICLLGRSRGGRLVLLRCSNGPCSTGLDGDLMADVSFLPIIFCVFFVQSFQGLKIYLRYARIVPEAAEGERFLVCHRGLR